MIPPVPCDWCGEPLARTRRDQRYHAGACRRGANQVMIEISHRLRALSRALGTTPQALRERLACEVCGGRSARFRGPARRIPFPSYRVLLGRILACPRCAQALNGAALDCPPVVLRWLLSRFGTRATDRPPDLGVPLQNSPNNPS